MATPRVSLGQLVATRAAVSVLSEHEIAHAVERHRAGDWGELDVEDAAANDHALKSGERLLSVYHSATGQKFYVITEWDRSVTTVLLPQDY